MKRQNRQKLIRLIELLILIIVISGFIVTNVVINKEQIEKNGDYGIGNEFLRTIDCAPIFDNNPNGVYKISFDIKSTKDGNMCVYQQNGAESRYYFNEQITVSTIYQHFELIVTPVLKDEKVEESFLSFYGEYGTGICPIVKNICVEELKDN